MINPAKGVGEVGLGSTPATEREIGQPPPEWIGKGRIVEQSPQNGNDKEAKVPWRIGKGIDQYHALDARLQFRTRLECREADQGTTAVANQGKTGSTSLLHLRRDKVADRLQVWIARPRTVAMARQVDTDESSIRRQILDQGEEGLM